VNAGPYIPKDLDKIIHERTRLRIFSALAAQSEMDFVSLKKLFGLSDGSLNPHLRILENNKYMSVKKKFVNRKPKTTYRLTQKGRQAFRHYIDQLEEIVQQFSSGGSQNIS
jgi:DNA-binding PadR family transcriptional regulator